MEKRMRGKRERRREEIGSGGEKRHLSSEEEKMEWSLGERPLDARECGDLS